MIIEDPYEHKRAGRFKYRPHQEHQAVRTPDPSPSKSRRILPGLGFPVCGFIDEWWPGLRSPYASRIGLLPPSFYFTFTFTPFVSFHQLAHWIWVIRFTEAEAEAERPLSGHPTRPTAP